MKVLNNQKPIGIRNKLLQFRKKWLSGLRKSRPPSPEVPRKEAAQLEDTEKCAPSRSLPSLRASQEGGGDWEELTGNPGGRRVALLGLAGQGMLATDAGGADR